MYIAQIGKRMIKAVTNVDNYVYSGRTPCSGMLVKTRNDRISVKRWN